MLNNLSSRAAKTYVVLTILAIATICAPAMALDSPVLGDRDGDGRVGEETAIKERINAYVERHGRDGVLTGRQMLARARASYDDWLDHRAADKQGVDGENWVNIGPVNGAGRASCIAPHPIYEGFLLQGSASGGVWKTLDGGITWYPTTDGLSDLSVGAIAWAPSEPDVVYVGTGEGDTLIAGGSGGIPGIGMLRSDDGGESWTIASDETDPVAEFFFALDVDPQDDESVFAATEQGLLHTTNGGATWDVLLSSDGNSYAYTEILRSENNPNLMYAGQWCEGTCPGDTAPVMKSTDGGETWFAPAGEGLPGFGGYVNRNALAMSRMNDQILYFAKTMDRGDSGDTTASIFRSDDGGETWTETNLSSTPRARNYLGFQGWYDNTITVKPNDPNVVIAGGVWYVITENGGETWRNKNPYQGGSQLPHVDAHDLQWQGNTLWLACDGGVWFSEDNGLSWVGRNDGVVTRQYYGIDVDPVNRERVIGGTQDNGTDLRRDEGDDTVDAVLGGDGFECAINPLLPDIMYGTIYYTSIYRKAATSSSFRNISPELKTNEDAPFITPLILHPTMPNVVLTGGEYLYRSEDGGDTWLRLPIDPVGDVPGLFWFPGEIKAIAATPADPDRLMVSKGSAIMATRDAGRTWSWALLGGTSYNVAISPFDPDVAFASMQASDSGAGILKSTDGGETWLPSGTGLRPFNVQVVRFDPLDENVAYAGTDVGLYRTTDGGATWARFGNGLPATSVHDVKILPDGSMLRVGTYGRGFWELAIDRPANTAPQITITQPAASTSTPTTTTMLEVAATATDADGEELTVEWYFSTNYEVVASTTGSGTVTSQGTVNVESSGLYELVARATDSRGLQAVDFVTLIVTESADSCETPRIIPGNGPFPTSILTHNGLAFTESSDPFVECLDEPDADPNSGRDASVWFEFTPEMSGTYAVSTCGSTADTVLSTWTGDACGPYAPVDGGCNDNDDREHCNLRPTASYVEVDLVADETVRFMVGAAIPSQASDTEGPFQLTVDCLTCNDGPDEMLTLVTASAHADGLNNTTWATDLVVYNPTAEEATARLAFLPAGADNSNVPEVEISIPAGEARAYSDVVSDLLGSEGSGAVRMLSTSALIVASRTFNNSEDGTFGQFIPGETLDSAVPAGDSALLTGLAGNAAFRTNIGFANGSAMPASVTVDLFDAEGTNLGRFEQTLQPWGWLQLNRVFSTVGAGAVSAATALVTNTSEEAPIFTYGSVVDSETGDPTFVTRTSAGTAEDALWIAASAHADGVGSSVWRTDLNLTNTSGGEVTATIDLLQRGADNSMPMSSNVAVPAGMSLAIGGVLDAAFGMSGTAALRVRVSGGELLATSRTFNQAETGTFGQFIPGVLQSSAMTEGQIGVLPMVRSTEDFRTNFGLVNLGLETVSLKIEVFDVNANLVVSKNYVLPALGYLQDGNAIPASISLEGGFALVTTNTANGTYLAYASVIDNGSDDPIYVPVVAAES